MGIHQEHPLPRYYLYKHDHPMNISYALWPPFYYFVLSQLATDAGTPPVSDSCPCEGTTRVCPGCLALPAASGEKCWVSKTPTGTVEEVAQGTRAGSFGWIGSLSNLITTITNLLSTQTWVLEIQACPKSPVDQAPSDSSTLYSETPCPPPRKPLA